MNQLLQATLQENYPSLFSLKDNKNEPLGAYGIECDDGWYEIISSLCFMIDQQERNIKGNNKYRISKNQEPIAYESFRFTQIKEKFGGLRIYYYGGNEYVRGLIGMAESWSYQTCEKCGDKGKIDKKGWIRVLCNKCNNHETKNTILS
jgi:hypothetical protein